MVLGISAESVERLYATVSLYRDEALVHRETIQGRRDVLEFALPDVAPRDRVRIYGKFYGQPGARTGIMVAQGSLTDNAPVFEHQRRFSLNGGVAKLSVGWTVELDEAERSLVLVEKRTASSVGSGASREKETLHSPPHRGVNFIRPDERETPEGVEYVVWYATNREREDPGNVSRGYSKHRDNRVHYGRCYVVVPRSHKIGETGSPLWKRLLTGDDDRLRINTIEELAENEHWDTLRDHLAKVTDRNERHAVVFIHGFRVSFKDAAVRAAQIGYDLSVPAMAMFSWPSRGTIKGYAADEASIQASEDEVGEYLSAFAAQSGASQVHVIAHSMGNRGLLRAVERTVAAAVRASGIPFGQFILAAPDVDIDVFRDLSKAYDQLCQRATLYQCDRDKAVGLSRFIHGQDRIGLSPPVTVVSGTDTVNVTNVDLSLLGHGYVAESRDVLNDMHGLIYRNAAPDDRMGLRSRLNDSEQRYWEIGA